MSIGITFDAAARRFTLRGREMTYALHVQDGRLHHDHWGAPVADFAPPPSAPPPRGIGWQHPHSMELREYPEAGGADLRIAALRLGPGEFADLTYMGHRIVPGKPPLLGLPATHEAENAGVQTLVIDLHDDETGLQAALYYTLFPQHNAIARHVELCNRGVAPVNLEGVASFSVDMPPGDYALLQLSGGWAHERQVIRAALHPGEARVASRAGFSGHEHNPAVAILRDQADDDHGEVLGLALLYSGSFAANLEQSPQGNLRVVMGLNAEVFRHSLQPGETFHSPECLGVYARCGGLTEMSHRFHDLVRQHLVRGPWSHTLRPPLLNSWEAAYFNITADSLAALARQSRPLGLELLVVDDGWFGTRYPRNADTTALGDWTPNPAKLPEGLAGLARQVNDAGMGLGLWVEPEMVSPRSELYETHPDWCLRFHNRRSEPTLQRHQLILDMSRLDVQDYVIEAMSRILEAAPLQYIKWDCNRAMHEVASAALPARQQGEVQHRYMLGLYRVLQAMQDRFPQVLIESCAAGGGRFDMGMLPFTPQVWTSDNTDAADRLLIQWGTSYFYPASTMAAHVSAVPNHQTGRSTPFRFRNHVAMMGGSFGYEMDVGKLTLAEQVEAKQYLADYRAIQPLVHHGDLYRLRSPFPDQPSSNWPAWSYVAKDGSAAVVFAFQQRAAAGVRPAPNLVLRGLEDQATYRIEPLNLELSGQTLQTFGLQLPFRDDWDSHLLRLTRL